MQLILPDHTSPKAPWVHGLVETLARGLPAFGVDVRRGPVTVYKHAPRFNQSTTIIVNGCDILLDTWDYTCPTYQILDRERPDHSRLHAVIKIQTKAKMQWPHMNRIPVVPWTMFHTAQLDWFANLEARREQVAKTPKTHIGGFTGRMWGERRAWVAAMPKECYCATWPGRQRTGDTDSWLEELARWEVGIILKGKSDKMTDGKNRREVEFASLRIPMVLNYKPYYGDKWPLIPGFHYVYCDKPEGMLDAVLSASKYAEGLTRNAYQWWNETASPMGACWSFLRLMIQLKLEDENRAAEYERIFHNA